MAIEYLQERFVYVVGEDDAEGPHKIGVCNRPPGTRDSRILSDLQRGNPRKLTMHIAVDALTRERAATAEKRAHEMLAARHIRGEWFAVDRGAAISISAVHDAVAALAPEESPAE